MIEYDKRIKDPNKILTPFSSGMEDYYGKECYCTDDLYDFRDLKVCTVDTLVDRPIINKEYQFATENGRFKYCLPSEFVEKPIKKQLRPFASDKELPFTVGDKIYFKGKGLKLYVYTIVTALNYNSHGTLTGINFGCLDIIVAEDLFNDYEWKFGLDSEWRPFGVEE
jgi:hypothetical protein